MDLGIVLVLIAAVLFGVATFVTSRFNLMAAGLCLLTIGVWLIPALR